MTEVPGLKPEWRWETWYPKGEADPLVGALGEILFVFGELEHLVKDWTVQLLGAGARGYVALRGHQFGQSVDILIGIAEKSPEIPPDQLSRLVAWGQRAKDAANERNKVIHAKWAPSEEHPPNWRRIRQPRKGEFVTSELVSIADIQRVRDITIAVLGEGAQLCSRVVAGKGTA